MGVFSKVTFLLITAHLSSCAKKESSESAAAQGQASYPLYVGAIAIGDAAESSSGGLRLADSAGFRNRSIASGSPSEVQITVLSMHLSNGLGSSSVPIFLDDVGKTIKVHSGYVDLSNLFQKIECLANGEVIELEDGQTCECGLNSERKPIQKVTVDPVTGEDFGELRCPSVQPTDIPGVAAAEIEQKGTYSFLNMKIKAKAQMKGCVTGHFMYAIAQADDDKIQTFCTQADKSIYKANKDSFVNSDFESISNSKTAELMDIALDTGRADFATQETIEISFPISGSIEIGDESAPQITLGIDLGRALRFSGLFESHPRETMGSIQSKGSFFFPLEPKNNMFTFVGEPGKILAHSWNARVGVVDTETAVPANKTCPANSSDCHVIAGWLTTIFAGDGTALVSNLIPDDDNALTVLKGSNFSPTGYDLEVFEKVSENVYDLSYTIPSTGSRGLAGKISAIDFSKAVGESQTTGFTTSSMSNGKFSYGQITLDREL